ncbi:atrial natriuretic peptide receptor 1-like [Paramacrobiotus metropolitanus]|uniref:atrial natriuretic peptide receptor 1-like n=1 Tax=Paramacrobiotus metropolitanus TaxID=2943436 RepID=UPI002445C6D4|nr:atrial natriuretic peptide receptor 1-like [Paramacrobiotus metropolitanus]
MNVSQSILNSTAVCSVVNLEIITLAFLYPVNLGSMPYVGPAYRMALETIRQSYPRLNITQTIISDKKYNECTAFATDVVYLTAEHLNAQLAPGKHRDKCSASVMLFSGCAEIQEIVPYATQLDKLIITTVATNPTLRKKTITPTWIGTTCNSFQVFLSMVFRIAQKFNWTSVAIVADLSANPAYKQLSGDSANILNTNGRQGYQESYSSTIITNAERTAMLRRLNDRARVYVYYGDFGEFRRLLLAASNLSMTNGEHVYIPMAGFRKSREPGYYSWDKGDSDDEIVKQAYRSVLLMEFNEAVYGKTNGSRNFSQEMIQGSREMFNYTYKPFERVTPHPAATYETMLILAQVMEELRSTGNQEVWSSGRKLAKQFWNRTFTTEIGDVWIDEVGERLPVMSLTQLEWNSTRVRTLYVLKVPEFTLVETGEEPRWLIPWPPPNEPRCGFRGDAPICHPKGALETIIGASVGTATATLFFIFIAAVFVRRAAHNASISDAWRIRYEQLQPLEDKEDRVRIYLKRNQMVWITPVCAATASVAETALPFPHFNNPLLPLLKTILEVDHANVCRFAGLCFLEKSVLLVSEYCPRGSVLELMARTHLEFDLQASFLFDLLKGLQAIHRSAVKFHGFLNIHCCLLNKHFSLKIGKTGHTQIQTVLTRNSTILEPANHHSTSNQAVHEEGRKHDMFTTGLILYQIIIQEEPLDTLEFMHKRIADHSENKFSKLFPVLVKCLSANPEDRPSVGQLLKFCFFGLGMKDNENLVERIVRRLENYTDELDRLVVLRTMALLDERKKCDALLREMLPSIVIEQLRRGIVPDAEMFLSSTIMFTEIGGFANILYAADPKTVMLFLNNVYTSFDRIVASYDVYKVETIKDSYMVVSGIPVRNGDLHAQEICALAMEMLGEYRSMDTVFPGTSLRAGIHSGICAAGVVGHKVPRYCLFGDTVNTASRILTNGADGRIHLSKNAAQLLPGNSPYKVQERGLIEVKGKAEVFHFPDMLVCVKVVRHAKMGGLFKTKMVISSLDKMLSRDGEPCSYVN